MTETERLIVEQGKPTWPLWDLINSGWSVVSAVYRPLKRQFIIELSEENWPAITIPCSGCGVRMPPAYLAFAPFPQDQHLCIVCNK